MKWIQINITYIFSYLAIDRFPDIKLFRTLYAGMIPCETLHEVYATPEKETMMANIGMESY